MKRFFMIATAICGLVFSGMLTTGCQFDDTAIWDEINNVKDELSELKSDVDQMQQLLEQLASNKGIVSVEETNEGYIITFTDGSKIVLKNGKDGANGQDGADGQDGQDGADGQDGKDGSQIGVKEENGIYYWTIDGEFLLIDGEKVPVTGNDGHTPVLSIDEEGYWCVDGERILVNGEPVAAQGDSFFQSIEVKNGEVIFTMADGSSFVVPLSTGAILEFNTKIAHVNGTEATLSYKAEKLTFVAIDDVPEGVAAVIDEANKTVKLTIADPASLKAGSQVIIKGADEKGYAMLAAAKLFPSLKNAEYLVLNEGWFGHEGGTVNAYFDGVWDLRAYKNANPGLELGTTSTVAVQVGERVYMVSKDGTHLVEAEAATMKHLSAVSIERCQAQNFAAISETEAYLSTDDGLYALTLNPVVLGDKIYGESTGDIFAAEGKIYFISGGKAYFYDPATKAAPVVICNAISGFARAGEYIYAAEKAALHKIKIADNTVENITISGILTNPWAYTPSSLSATTDGKYIIFSTGKDITRYNPATAELKSIWAQPSGKEFYGAGLSVSPKNNKIYAISKKAGWGENGKIVDILMIDPETGAVEKTMKYTSVENTYWFPSQIFFIK